MASFSRMTRAAASVRGAGRRAFRAAAGYAESTSATAASATNTAVNGWSAAARQGKGFVRTWNSPAGRSTLAAVGRGMVSGRPGMITGGGVLAGAALGAGADSDHRLRGAIAGGLFGGALGVGYNITANGGPGAIRKFYNMEKGLTKKNPLQLPSATYGGKNHYANLMPYHRGPEGPNSFVIPNYFDRR